MISVQNIFLTKHVSYSFLLYRKTISCKVKNSPSVKYQWGILKNKTIRFSIFFITRKYNSGILSCPRQYPADRNAVVEHFIAGCSIF